jgi:lysophospholipase L1-like esterase
MALLVALPLIASFATATAGGAANASGDSSRQPADAVATTPTRYVALGDSLSSGEGNPPFQSGTDTAADRCHRSGAAYPELLAGDAKASGASLTFVACSGAMVPDLFGTSTISSGQWGEAPQINSLLTAGNPDPSISLVTISIGGNDFGFGSDLSACIAGPHHAASKCRASSQTRYNNALVELAVGGSYGVSAGGVGFLNPNKLPAKCKAKAAGCIDIPSLIGLYREIHRDAPNASIRVLGYPQLFPAKPSRSCTVGTFNGNENYSISKANMTYLNQLTTNIDNVIANHVTEARFIGVTDIQFVPTTKAFHGHSFCSGSPWFNRLTWTSRTNVNASSAASFHPNAQGQQHFEQLVAASL